MSLVALRYSFPFMYSHSRSPWFRQEGRLQSLLDIVLGWLMGHRRLCLLSDRLDQLQGVEWCMYRRDWWGIFDHSIGIEGSRLSVSVLQRGRDLRRV